MADIDGTFIPSLFTPSALLPIAKYRQELLYTIEKYPVTIVIGQTGSGKTTQLPQFLDQAGWCADGKIIAVTQPRRVAATSVAIRVAEEVGCTIGEDVGYSIRFEDVTSAKTRIKFLTDGLLLREALVDPLLSRYSVIMVDEAHERSLSSDILLGVLKKIRKRRPELRIIVSSATIQAEDFLRFFADTAGGTISTTTSNGQTAAQVGGEIGTIFYLGGRTFPVDVLHLEEPTPDYVERALDTVFAIHASEPPGDILVFLTGREEITTTIQSLTDRSLTLHPRAQALLPLPLYAGLPTEDQRLIFAPAPENTRKVVVATNIAEASLTIDGIAYVIDSGFVKLRAYNPATGIFSLTLTPVSKASATQRGGRAGRTKPGKCYRLYTAAAYTQLPESTVPEIQRADLAPTILQLKALGIDNVARFEFLTAPPAELVARALELLYSLGALDEYAKLTRPLGTRMADLALEPMMAKSLLSASTFNVLPEMLSIAAMTSLEGGSVWFSHHDRKAEESSRRAFAAEEGDHLTLLNVYQAFVTRGRKEAKWCHAHGLNYKSLTRAVAIRNQLQRQLTRFGIPMQSDSNPSTANADGGSKDKAKQILRALTTGFFAHAARMQPDGTYVTVNGGATMNVHPSSLMFNRKADWVVFHEVMEMGGAKASGVGAKAYIRDISKIEKSWLVEFSAGFYKLK